MNSDNVIFKRFFRKDLCIGETEIPIEVQIKENEIAKVIG